MAAASSRSALNDGQYYMPPTIPYATLPSTEDLGPADREALIEHGMALKTLSTNQALKEMKKCA